MALSRLPRATAWGALHALSLVPVVEVGLRVLSLPALCRMLGVGLVRTAVSAPRIQLADAEQVPLQVRQAQHAVRLALRPWGTSENCLRRSLLLGHLLRRRGATLKLGVRRSAGSGSPRPPGGIEAHAWVEVGALALDDARFLNRLRPLAFPYDAAGWRPHQPPPRAS